MFSISVVEKAVGTEDAFGRKLVTNSELKHSGCERGMPRW